MKKDELPELVDGFGRMQESEFPFDELVDHVRGETGKVDEDDLYDLAATSDYLFESWNDPLKETFIPRRAFFQAAQFRITPLKEEVEGGFVFPGHRFFPFISREVFPADARLVLPNGSALRTRKIALPVDWTMACLHFFGPPSAMEYLILDQEANAAKLKPPYKGEINATVFDLRDFFTTCIFRQGDSLMLTVIDWLQGVFSVSHVSASPQTADMVAARDWVHGMREAFEEAKLDLATDGDCYEQLAHMMHLAEESPGGSSLMKNPPLSIEAFFNMQKDLTVQQVGDRGLFWEVGADPLHEAMLDDRLDPRDLESELDVFFHELGLSIGEGEAEAYMRDALFQGAKNPDAVLARVAAGRSLFFRSAEDQEDFHGLWCDLWEDVCEDYNPDSDPYGEIRANFLALNDKCLTAMRRLDKQGADEAVLKNPVFMEFGKLTAMLSAALNLCNVAEDVPMENPSMFGIMLENIAPAVEDMIARMEGI